MIEKLEYGVVEIAAYGEVSAEKATLLNSLLGEKAFEVEARCGVTTLKCQSALKLVQIKIVRS